MTIYQSDILEWTDEDEQLAVKKIAEMISSPKSSVRKSKDGSCDVYDVTMGKEKATIVNLNTDENTSGCWKIFVGKFEKQGIGPFVDGSDFDKNFSNGKGIKNAINNKLVAQQVVKSHSLGMNR